MLNSIRTALLLSFAFVLSGCDRSEVGDVSLGMFTLKDIKINNLTDPIVTGVTCHVASIEADLSLADPAWPTHQTPRFLVAKRVRLHQK